MGGNILQGRRSGRALSSTIKPSKESRKPTIAISPSIFKTAGEGDSLTFLSQIQCWSKVPLQYLQAQFTAKGSVWMVVILLA